MFSVTVSRPLNSMLCARKHRIEKMGDTWITNMHHFLDTDGLLPDDLPGPAFRLANYLGSIVQAVSSREGHKNPRSGIRCRRRPGRKPCPGEILALIDAENNFAITWHCMACDDNGIISGWQGTIWDKTKGP